MAHLGTLYAGAVSLPLNPRFTPEELHYFLDDSGARVVFAGADQRPILDDLCPAFPNLRGVLSDTAVWEAPQASYRTPHLQAKDPCLLMYSSGTTGWPKGVIHTQANMASGLLALRDCWRVTAEDRVVNVLPLFHIHGLAFATHVTLLAGGCVLLEESFQPLQTLAAIHRGTLFMAVPTIYYRLLEQPEFASQARTWPHVRLWTCGSAPIRPEVLPQLQEILGRPVINRYGMTEAFVITSLPLEGPWPVGSVGLPLAGIDVQVVGSECVPLSAGEVGAVRLRGPNLFRGYWNKPEATQAAFADGWFDTGDFGYRDAAGFLTLVGRKNDLIITNGYNVYPQVVERVLNGCPGVRESAVLGLPDERRGEQVVAVVVRDDPALDESRLHAYLAERLVDYQRPRSVAFVDSLPRNAMGKVLRRELRESLLHGAERPG
jgi:malonyl-CoA/methylmalonyl-CoA synthetase